MKFSSHALLGCLLATGFGGASAQDRPGCLDDEPEYGPHIVSVHPDWKDPEVLWTVGQTCSGYTPPGTFAIQVFVAIH